VKKVRFFLLIIGSVYLGFGMHIVRESRKSVARFYRSMMCRRRSDRSGGNSSYKVVDDYLNLKRVREMRKGMLGKQD